MKTITNTIYPAFAPFVLACFALAPQARATCQDACLTNNNTVQGDNALINNTTGRANTAIGDEALLSNTTGNYNVANGSIALGANTIGNYNTAAGANALGANTIGNYNTATGANALGLNLSGTDNTATGVSALYNNIIGINNTANGFQALALNTTGSFNTAIGHNALARNTSGRDNMAIGYQALQLNTSGNANIAVGNAAGRNLSTGDRNIDIGNSGVAGEASTIRIGTTGTQTNAYIAGISGATVPTGVPVVVDTTGHLGTTTSSARYKEDIKPMDKTSEAILALKPVTFRYKKELDPESIPQFGLVAEQVEKVNPDLVARDEQGKPYTVRYEAVNAMLLNEFLKEHRKVEQMQKQIEALTARLEKVSAQLELSKAAPRTVQNNQ